MAITRLVSGMPASFGGTPEDPPVYETTYEGAVLDVYERNGYDDSDFYAIVWDAEKGQIEHVMYATTRGWTYCNGASIDASEPEGWFRNPNHGRRRPGGDPAQEYIAW